MAPEKSPPEETRNKELADTLTAISVVSERLAEKVRNKKSENKNGTEDYHQR